MMLDGKRCKHETMAFHSTRPNIYNECVHGVDKETFKGVYNDAIDADPYNFILVDNKTIAQDRKVRKDIL